FTYNGHTYILVFVLLSISICFWVYHKFRKIKTANLLVGPIVIWLLISGAMAVYLPGASFFIVPLFALLAAFLVVVNQETPNPYLLVFLTLPALWIYAPFIKMFPVGLGLKMMVASTLLATLVFLLLMPLFGFYQHKNRLAYLGIVLFIGYMVSAHFNAGFDEDNAKPTSLLYVLNADEKAAQWATYEHVVSDWTGQYVNPDNASPKLAASKTLSSKYSTGFTFTAEAPLKEISSPKIEKTRDTIIGEDRLLEICITPRRPVNRLEIFTNDIQLKKASVNQIPLSDYFLENRRRGKLVTHYITDNAYTELTLTLPKDSVLELTLYEASNDLLDNPLFTVPSRPKDAIPMPFVLNDAILVTKTVRFE
ncbi:MAG: peptidase M28, partial [Flavobacteriaceae bacterium]